ncbi:GAF domain-containing protein [Variovorax sp. KK3]|uniref:GAF domain-containing protein n=1 Tax=Variovorax sp. KK3 TaxID=1855728 RepID=UPI0009FB0845|nr:GAF domain-containing protein [Variovorax sp. KK3]
METFAMDSPSTAADEDLDARLGVITAKERFPSGEVSVDRAIGDLLVIVRDLLGLQVAFVSEFVDGARVFRHIQSIDSALQIRPGDSAPLEHTICQRILDGRLPNVVQSITDVREEQGLPDAFDGMGTHIGVPVLRADGTVYGMLCAFNAEGESLLDERDLRRLELAASTAARLLARADGREFSDPALA